MASRNPYEAVLKQLEEKNKQDVATAQAQAGTQAQQSYIDYMNSIKNLGQGLAQQGITGGGSESALLGANVGYQRQKNLVASGLSSNLQNLSQNYMANRTAVETQSAEWLAQKQAQDEQRFANTITGYDTVAKVDNAIEAAQTAGETWKVPYLMAQRAAILERAKAEAEAEAAARASVAAPSVAKTPTTSIASGYSSQGIPYSSGGLSGTQGGMTSSYYPTRPLTNYSAPTTQRRTYGR